METDPVTSSGTKRLIAVDVGNTSMHVALFEAFDGPGLPEPVRVTTLSHGEPMDSLGQWLGEPWPPCFVASVNHAAADQLAAWLGRQTPPVPVRVLRHLDVPLAIEVERPETVGMDRLMAAVAVNRLRGPQRGAIVVDAGTAITVEAIGPDGAYLGGAIMPGLKMSAQALAAGTDLLPVVEIAPGEMPPAVAKTTEDAIRAGIGWGAVGAIRHLIDRTTAELSGDPQLFLTGGDAEALAPLIGEDVAPVPHLVVGGIALTAAGLIC